jgi:acyl-CoA reductase-like NAD-dependent aldehyde dehydrogenase
MTQPEFNELMHINFYDDVKLLKEPLGVVLIMAPYNYPIKLTTYPAHGAIAAGNCVIMKPSHLAPKSAALLAKLIPKYLDPVRTCKSNLKHTLITYT